MKFKYINLAVAGCLLGNFIVRFLGGDSEQSRIKKRIRPAILNLPARETLLRECGMNENLDRIVDGKRVKPTVEELLHMESLMHDYMQFMESQA